MKRIITCCDGTWNKPGQKDGGVVTMTNVQKIAHLICTTDPGGVTQLTHYHPGVGTSGNWLQRLAGGVAGSGLDQNIIEAYRFIALNYEDGDLNFIFGFSRGAYTARSLAGMIVKCGILKKEHIGRISEAFEFYRNRDPGTHPNKPLAMDFKAKYSHEPAIHFIGVWDTVGDLGIPLQPFAWLNRTKYAFHDTQLANIVRYAYHALAIDEHRKLFKPTLWQRSENGKLGKAVQTIEQVWFPGCHSNVGGGYQNTDLSDATLHWMTDKATGAGLAFNKPFPPDIHPDIPAGMIRESLSFWWKITQFFLTYYRTIFLQDTICIEQSVKPETYRRQNYPAPNLPPDPPNVRRLLPGQTATLTILAAEPCSFAMIEVKAGENYQLVCDGTQRWKDASITSSPKGYFNLLAWLYGLRLKGVPCFCLCGLYDCNDKSAFAIGSGTSLTAAQDGMISFFANDTTSFYFNNSGSLQLNITRTS